MKKLDRPTIGLCLFVHSPTAKQHQQSEKDLRGEQFDVESKVCYRLDKEPHEEVESP